MTYTSYSEEDTLSVGLKVGAKLKKGDVVLLEGEPGAGKTVMARGIAMALGITGHITSPTFTIINEYKGEIPLYHMDAYRIGSAAEMEDAGFSEYITDGGIYGPGVVVIEWPGNISEIIPYNAIHIKILKSTHENPNPNLRTIEVL